ncbi:GNAT family N-acetyltransferase [Vulcaniibacterium tengchongense]|uniref:Acetyltransferase (GNAT) family protein n=1 Tax=Vulcaniibacterium tengchongense TaxID=1273429 RepID=A0A3N4W516_9GAMM|nr:GNAT family N-acetyltransferase [Vulcaniibacterium tengchongense]RPE81180.1 acetyltransferase (GNAT) family protein [Vulcaniibacterium tengchongense]
MNSAPPAAAPAADVRCFVGAAIAPFLDDLARLRIAVFRDWPYLYDGDADYEAQYLRTYLRSPRSIAVLAFDGGRVVGASTGLPLADEDEAFLAPFADGAIDPKQVFYCGESVLLPRYRGRGLGHRFFDEREAHARRLGGYAWTAFCAVDRDPDDPRRPGSHRGNEAFWNKRGYRPRPDLRARLPWREVGRGEVEHSLTFWLRPLERA